MRVPYRRRAALAAVLFLLFLGWLLIVPAAGAEEETETEAELINVEGTEDDGDVTEAGEGHSGHGRHGHSDWFPWWGDPGWWAIPPGTSSPSSSSQSNGVITSEVVPVTAEVVESEANIREKAGSSAALLVRLGPGDRVTILGQTTGTDNRVWYRVRCENGLTGYVRYDRVDVICGTAQFGGSTEPTGRCIGQTNTRAVNVRLQMSTASDRLRLLKKGQSVTVICRARDASGTPWYYVRTPTGPLGYIHGSYLTVTSGTAADAYRGKTGTASNTNYTAGTAAQDSGTYGGTESASSGDDFVYPQTVYATAAPAQETAADSSASRESEEVLYLRYLVDHLDELNASGSGYKGYSLFDFDGDGVQELLVNCGAETGWGWRVFTCEGGTEVTELGRVAGNGYYAARPGGGVLILHLAEDGKTRYELIRKAGNALVTVCELERTQDAYGSAALWTVNQKLVSESSLRVLLADFPEDTLLSLGISAGQQDGSGTDPYGYGTDSWDADPLPGSDGTTDMDGPGPDDVVNG